MIQTTEGLDAAYAKISLLADNAWHYNNGDPYILAHQNIWMIECALRDPCEKTGIPRSVLDTIPSSRLAQYGTYFYNDEREKQYWEEEYDKLAIGEKIDITGCFFPEQIEKLFTIFIDPSLKIAELKQRYREALFGRDFVHRTSLTEAILSASEEYNEFTRDHSCRLRKTQSEYYLKTIPYPAPRGTATTFAELVLQMQLHSEEIRSLWPPSNHRSLNANVPEFYPKYSYEHATIFKDPTKPDYANVMVTSLGPWLNETYPLRGRDFHEIDVLSAEFQSLFVYDKYRRPSPTQSRRSIPFAPPDSPSVTEDNHPFAAALTTNHSSPSIMMNREQHSESALSSSKNPPQTQVRRLYSAVLQNHTAKNDLAKTPSVEELEELEREALEQYRPSEESLTKASNDSISSDKFQELERLAMEQYNSSSATSVEAGNEFTPLHEPPCGGRLTPYAALLVANSKLAGFYRSLARTWLLTNLYAAGALRFR